MATPLSGLVDGIAEDLDAVIEFMAARLAACRANRSRRAFKAGINRYPGRGASTVFRGIDDYFIDRDFRTPESKKKNDPGPEHTI